MLLEFLYSVKYTDAFPEIENSSVSERNTKYTVFMSLQREQILRLNVKKKT